MPHKTLPSELDQTSLPVMASRVCHDGQEHGIEAARSHADRIVKLTSWPSLAIFTTKD